MKAPSSILTLTLAVLLSQPAVLAHADSKEGQAEFAKALSTVKVTLGAGLAASSAEGKPISAKFELEDGKLQLSVYTEKGGKFYEVVVDHDTGKVAKSEPITEGEDLAAAKGQSDAISKAKLSLQAAVGKAVAADKGFRAVSVSPETKDGHPVATVTLVKGQDWKTISEKLD